jgi:murein DD-endopeptidase MepM/ murein hydrolase activator NlpD
MIGDRWTLLLFRGNNGPAEQYTFSPKLLKYGAGALAALGLVAVGALYWATGEGAGRLEAQRLGTEKAILVGELETLRGQVANLEGTLAVLSEQDARLRLLAGLDMIDSEVLQVGVGGPGLATPEENPLFPVDAALGATAFAVSYDVKALERRAALLYESGIVIADSLAAHRDLLESTPSILPTPGLLSSSFSKARWHPVHHRPLPHEGIDVSAPKGTPILAAAKGTVIAAGWVAGYGQMVEIDHGYGYVTRYGHASQLLVKVGQSVNRGDAIAKVGSTGIATSAHLHYEVRVNGQPRNPMEYVLTDFLP